MKLQPGALTVIKQSVTARDAAEALGLNPDRNNRCRCVWHADSNPSLKLYGGSKGCYCFSCHNGGDVINLTMQTLGLSLMDAAEWLNEKFRLGLEETADRESADKCAQARQIAEQRQRQRQQEEADRSALIETMNEALTAMMEADDVIEKHRPRKYGDDFSEAFCTALAAREELKQIQEDLAIMVSQQEERRRA